MFPTVLPNQHTHPPRPSAACKPTRLAAPNAKHTRRYLTLCVDPPQTIPPPSRLDQPQTCTAPYRCSSACTAVPPGQHSHPPRPSATEPMCLATQSHMLHATLVSTQSASSPCLAQPQPLHSFNLLTAAPLPALLFCVSQAVLPDQHSRPPRPSAAAAASPAKHLARPGGTTAGRPRQTHARQAHLTQPARKVGGG